jgi:hypothetical protein
MTVLARTIRTLEAHPDNRRALAPGAGWVFLLSSLQLDEIVVAGSVPEHALRMLESIATQVQVLDDPRALHIALAARPSLLWVPAGSPAPRIDPADAQLAQRRFAPGAAGEGVSLWHLWDDRARYTVAADEAQLVAPLRRLASDRGLNLRNTLVAYARRRRNVALRPVRTRLVDPAGAAAGRLPAYLAEAVAGTEAESLARWTLVTTADYPSQKAVLLLYGADATAPSAIVKLPMAIAFDERLENEHRALAAVAALGGQIAGRAPRPIALRRHGPRSVLVESAVAGRPFTSLPQPAVQSPQLDDAIEQVTLLGSLTRTERPAAEAAAALGRMVELYDAAYAPAREEIGALMDFVAQIGAWERVPTVLEHGDPGVWNLFVDDAGRTLFTDWEASDPDGMPTWDLFHLLRSYAMLRRGWRRDSQFGTFAAAFVRGGRLTAYLREAVAAYAASLRIEPGLIEPLYHLCWVHRAVKEATRLDAGRRSGGHYRRIVGLNIAFRGRLAVLSG